MNTTDDKTTRVTAPALSDVHRTYLRSFAARSAGWPRGMKTAARAACRNIIARTPDGTPVPGDVALLVAAILARHPDARAKAGCGIAGFTTATDPRYGTGRHFVVIRTDGSTTDFSWAEAITPTNRRQKILNAMRSAIEPQIRAFRTSQFPLTCALNTAHPGPYHVDHVAPAFQELADDYAAQHDGYENLTLLPHQDGDTTDQLDPEAAQEWARYHQAHAVLRLLCQPCNCNRRPA